MILLYTIEEGGVFHLLATSKSRRAVVEELKRSADLPLSKLATLRVNAVMFPNGNVWDSIFYLSNKSSDGWRPNPFCLHSVKRYQHVLWFVVTRLNIKLLSIIESQ